MVKNLLSITSNGRKYFEKLTYIETELILFKVQSRNSGNSHVIIGHCILQNINLTQI